jgi:hypothetical protein
MIWLVLQNSAWNPTTASYVAMGFGVLMLAYLILRTRLRRKDPLEEAPAKLSLAQQRSVERQMNTLLVELSEMARQISSQLDTRAAKLDVLVKEADQKIAELRRLEQALKDKTSLADGLPPAPPPPSAYEPDPRHAEVYLLADQGLDAQSISQKLSRPSGEIELILALRPRA